MALCRRSYRGLAALLLGPLLFLTCGRVAGANHDARRPLPAADATVVEPLSTVALQPPPPRGAPRSRAARRPPPIADFGELARGEKRTRSKPINGHFLSTSDFVFSVPGISFGFDGRTRFIVPGRLTVAENHSALPDNRTYFLFNHFHDTHPTAISDGSFTLFEGDASTSRYTIGVERATPSGVHSVELRLPMFGVPESVAGSQGVTTSDLCLGNLAIVTKHVLRESDERVLSAGLGIAVPTGDDAQFILTTGELYRVRNDSVHLVPYLSGLWTPGDRWFFNWLAEIDIPTAGNRVEALDVFSGGPYSLFGYLNHQVLFGGHATAGRFWFRDREAAGVTAVATQLELHYASTLNDADLVSGSASSSNYTFGNTTNRFDALTLTVGVEIEWQANTDFRVAGMIPLRTNADRFFSSEIMASLVRRY